MHFRSHCFDIGSFVEPVIFSKLATGQNWAWCSAHWGWKGGNIGQKRGEGETEEANVNSVNLSTWQGLFPTLLYRLCGTQPKALVWTPHFYEQPLITGSQQGQVSKTWHLRQRRQNSLFQNGYKVNQKLIAQFACSLSALEEVLTQVDGQKQKPTLTVLTPTLFKSTPLSTTHFTLP